MYPAQFDYHTPGTVKEALDLLGKYKDDAKLLAGGHSLLPAMKFRLARPAHVVDLRKVPGLAGIKEEGGSLVIGAMTTHWAVESSPLVKAKCPVLAQTAAQIGDPMVRNMGTIGGSLTHADPAADYPATIIALNAETVLAGPKGKRTIKVDDFFKSLMTTAVGPDEILTEVRVPVCGANVGCAYMKFPHPASRFAVVGVAAALTVEGGKVSKASQGRGGCPPGEGAGCGDDPGGCREGARRRGRPGRPAGLGGVQDAPAEGLRQARHRGRREEVALSRTSEPRGSMGPRGFPFLR